MSVATVGSSVGGSYSQPFEVSAMSYRTLSYVKFPWVGGAECQAVWVVSGPIRLWLELDLL